MYSKIKELCRLNNISVNQLETELEFSRGSIYKWDVNIPSIEKVKTVADYFGVTIDYLYSASRKGGKNENNDRN